MWRYPPRPQRYINFEPFHLTACRWSISSSDMGNAHFFTATRIQSREWEEREQTNKTLGVNSSAEGELCNIVHVQTNVSVDSSETSTKLLECRLDLLSLVWTLSHANSPLFSGVRCRLVTRITLHQLPTSQSLFLTLWLAFPSYFLSRRDLKSGFAPKQTKESTILSLHTLIGQIYVDLRSSTSFNFSWTCVI